MKIKEVCKQTGLTDKAIRTYIREGLVFPKYDEKYTGRRNFNFDDKDVQRLIQIAILRKYDFSLKEIKALFDEEVQASDLLNIHINEMKYDVDTNINNINSMVNVFNEVPKDFNDLCEKLNNPEIAKKPIPVIDSAAPYKLLYRKINKSNKIFITLFIITLVILLVLIRYMAISNFLTSFLFEHNSALSTFAGFCVIESDTTNIDNDDIEYDYEKLTDFVLLLDLDSEYIEACDINNSFESVDIKIFNSKPELKFNDSFNLDMDESYAFVKNVMIEAEMHPTKEYLKIVPIFYDKKSNDTYADFAFESYWIAFNEGGTEYESDGNISSNGIYSYCITFN